MRRTPLMCTKSFHSLLQKYEKNPVDAYQQFPFFITEIWEEPGWCVPIVSILSTEIWEEPGWWVPTVSILYYRNMRRTPLMRTNSFHSFFTEIWEEPRWCIPTVSILYNRNMRRTPLMGTNSFHSLLQKYEKNPVDVYQ